MKEKNTEKKKMRERMREKEISPQLNNSSKKPEKNSK